MRRGHAHPVVFMFLILPFGVMAGYLTVAVAYLLTQAGVSVGQVAGLVALDLLPHTWKFLWAPVADLTLSRKSWYVLAGAVSAAGICALGAVPASRANLGLFAVIVVVSNVAVTFLGMSVESLLAYGTPPEQKGRASGWFQAGNLGGTGVGGGLGLWLAHHLHAPWMSGAILAAACLLCCLGLFFVPEPEAAHRGGGVRRGVIGVGRDLWQVAASRAGFLALVLCFLPIGSGAASNLWAAVSRDWRATANVVALATGVLAGILSAAGCLLGGMICDRMDRKAAYALYGVLQALCAVGMALAPHSEAMYLLFTSLYAVIAGLTYAGFSAFVLEAMGLGAAATKYNVFASLSNMPILYMTSIDGWAHTRWGPNGMLLTEAGFGILGLVLFLGTVAVLRRRAPALAEAAQPAIVD